MKRFHYLLPLIVGLLTTVGLGNSAAHGETFRFSICNKSEVDAFAAISSRESPGSNQWVTEGWFSVKSGTCQIIGSFNTGWFYYFAEVAGDSSTYWGNGDSMTCVEYPGPFRYVSAGGDTCSERELKGFSARNIAPDIGDFTWTLR
ncbi:MAG TPA: DUF1036 domain-containing protein [Xanthobacteraceae bacterium]|nr:DUF1036 domain-containing protein [Xanthobacteraceae bacterium]